MVIQIPNPLLLPQSYGMGEIAGMAFGSNYVIMMQIGYRYYAPRIIEEMEKNKLDNPLGTVWWNKWQKFMKVYSDQSITNTMDRTLEMPEQALKAIWDKLFNILPASETTLTSGGSAGDDITLIRGGRPRTETDKERQQRLIRENEQKRLQAEADARNKKTIKAQGLTKADKIRITQTIGNQKRTIQKLILSQKLKLEQIKALWTLTQKNPLFKDQLNRLQWDKDRSILRRQIQEIDRNIQLLTASNIQLRKNLAGAGGLGSF